MANSAILNIYSALAALSPTPSSDVTVRVQAIGAVTSQLHTDDLPMRKLQAFANETEGTFSFVALGTTANVRWTIVDRFFYRIAVQGEGWEAFADELVKYAKSYIDILRTNRGLTSQSHVVEVSFRPFVTTFPDGGNTPVAGVDVVLTVEEVIP